MKIKRSLLSMFVFVFVFIFSIILIPSSKEGPEELSNTETKETGSPYIEQNQSISENDMTMKSLSSDLRRISIYSENTAIQQDESEEAKIETIAMSQENKDEAKSAAINSEEFDPSNKDMIQDTNSSENESKEQNEEKAVIEQKYANIGISIAESYVNIRDKASTNAIVLGKLYHDSAATILEKNGDWYYVESGSVKGYVSAEFIKTGLSDDKLIQQYGKTYIKVCVDGLNVRKSQSIDANKVTTIYQNEVYPTLNTYDEWIEIDVTDENLTGYVRRDFVDLQISFTKAVSKEEEQELELLKKEEALKKETEIKYRNGISYTNEDIKLLAALIHAEAGSQSYEGKLAVANIVLNRMKSSKFPSTMSSVFYQSGQFTVASSGSLQKQLNNYSNYSSNSQKLSIKAAKSALEGANNVGNRLYFHSYKSAIRKGYDDKKSAVKIDDQLFW